MNQRRMISSGMYSDEEFAQLSRDARLLFTGLIVHADDDGRITGNPKLLKAAIFPLDEDITSTEVQSFLNEIAKAMKSVIFYEADGKHYIAFENWSDYQTIRADRKRPSTLPSPVVNATKTQPVDNQLSTKPQPNVGISKDKLKEVKLREGNIPAARYTSLNDLTPVVLQELSTKHGIPYRDVELCKERMKNWLDSKGKVYRNYKAGLENWILGSIEKGTIKPAPKELEEFPIAALLKGEGEYVN